MLEFIMTELKNVAKDFYNATGIICVIYDDSRNVVYSYPQSICSFCGEIRTNSDLFEKCIDCDNHGMDMVDRTKNSHIYKCHMNLTEAIAPVLEDDTVIGYVMFGGIVNSDDLKKVKEKIRQVCDEYHMNESALFSKLDKLSVISDKQINSTVSLMKICGKYLYFNKIMQYKSDSISVKVKKYAEENYTKKISVSDICRDLYISESKLYSVSKAIFGMGISDYIRGLKINEAKRLLISTGLSVSAVASRVGYDDDNYFIRIFKKNVGCTPKVFRMSGKSL